LGQGQIRKRRLVDAVSIKEFPATMKPIQGLPSHTSLSDIERKMANFRKNLLRKTADIGGSIKTSKEFVEKGAEVYTKVQ
jgi:hypothetical protein